MATVHSSQPALPAVRKIGASDLRWALSEGWKDFKAKRGDLIFIGFIYPLACLVAVVFTFNAPLLPLLPAGCRTLDRGAGRGLGLLRTGPPP